MRRLAAGNEPRQKIATLEFPEARLSDCRKRDRLHNPPLKTTAMRSRNLLTFPHEPPIAQSRFPKQHRYTQPNLLRACWLSSNRKRQDEMD